MVNYKVVEPDPKRMIEGLRDTGYNFVTAVADIIDNSIAAEAETIIVIIEMDLNGEIVLKVSDDGTGMNEDDLENAMRYGSDERPDPMSLGKFGLGLKTASTAFCRKLSVITKSAKNGKLYKATWDLDHVARVGEWQLLLPEPSEIDKKSFEEYVGNSSGTLVVWENIDRIIKDYADPGGQFARTALQKRVERLKDHIAMTYQRFLDKEYKGEDHKVDIFVVFNQEKQKIKAWDPFVVDESELVAKETKSVKIEGTDKVLGKFSINAYVLPRREEFSSDEKWKNAKVLNELQGFYIYRENRLIHYADWLGLFSPEDHYKLLRVEFSFTHDLDDALQVDIKKSKIKLKTELRNWIRDSFIASPRKAANDRYRFGKKKKTTEIAETGAHDPSNKNIKTKDTQIAGPEISQVDEDKKQVTIKNKKGEVTLKLAVEDERRPDEIYIQPAESIIDGILWKPTFIKDNESGNTYKAVQINTGHDFYSKVYIPNIESTKSSSINVQGLDALLWALSVAELNTVDKDTIRLFEDIRYDVSRTLRLLVEDFPDPELDIE